MKVIHAMQKNRVSEACFGASSGYGYNDLGRETLEQVYADTFHTEACLVRPQITCGTQHWLLPCSEIYVRAMSCFPQSENHMIPWKKLSESVNPMALLLNTV